MEKNKVYNKVAKNKIHMIYIIGNGIKEVT